MKKLIALLLALVMVFALAACAAKTETPAPAETDTPATTDNTADTTEPAQDETPAADETSGEKMYIPVMAKGFQHQFWQAVAAGSAAAAADLNVDIYFDGPASETEIDAQVNMVKN